MLFADVVDFTPFAEQHVAGAASSASSTRSSAPSTTWRERHGLEKIKTIGDAYMVAGGLPEPRPDHAEAMAELALDMQAELAPTVPDARRSRSSSASASTRARSSPASSAATSSSTTCGATRSTPPAAWSRTACRAGIQVTEATYERLRDRYRFEERGEIEVKGKGRQRAYLLVGPADDAAERGGAGR